MRIIEFNEALKLGISQDMQRRADIIEEHPKSGLEYSVPCVLLKEKPASEANSADVPKNPDLYFKI